MVSAFGCDATGDGVSSGDFEASSDSFVTMIIHIVVVVSGFD